MDFDMVYRMNEFQFKSMKEKIFQPKLLLKKDVLLVISMLFISDDIVPDVSQMSSDLVSSTRFWF